MKDENSGSKLRKEIDKEDPVLLSYKERTEWKERHIEAYTRSAINVILAVGIMMAIIIAVSRVGDTLEMIKAILPIISGVISYIYGRKSR